MIRRRFVSSAFIVTALVCVDVASADWVSEIAGSNPLHWFRFEEAAGSTTVDDQGSADVDGTVVGTVGLGTPGLVGAAAAFDATGHVLVGGPDLPADWTLEAIFKADTENGGVSQGVIGADFTAADRTAIKAEQWNETGQLGYTVFGVVDETFADPSAATPTDYAHVALVGDAAGVSLFVNGVASDTAATPTALPRHIIGAGAIRDTGALIDGLTGMIDEIVIFDRALSSAEISAHANAVPEPTSVLLAIFSVLGLVAFRRQLRK